MTKTSAPAAEPAKSPEKTKKVHGVVFLSANRCKGCGFCIAFCPPKVLAFSEEFNAQGYHAPKLINPDGCTGCDLCGLYCLDFAIYGVMQKYPPRASAAPRKEANQ